LTITAHDDHHIRFFDNNTGKMVHSMVAHLDAVTSLAVDPNGLYLLSGSEINAMLKNRMEKYKLIIILFKVMTHLSEYGI